MRNKKVTLESTTIAFNKWRETKRKAGDAIPSELWDMVAEIYDHYPHTLICNTLNLKVAQLKSKGLAPNSHDFTADTIEDAAPSPFVHVPPTVDDSVIASPPIVPSSDMPSVEIQRPDGVKIIFKHHDNLQLTTALQQLIGA